MSADSRVRGINRTIQILAASIIFVGGISVRADVSRTVPQTLGSTQNSVHDVNLDELRMKNNWFFIGDINSPGKASRYKTDSRVVHHGQSFGFHASLAPVGKMVKMKVELHVPQSAERFPCSKCKAGTLRVSDDHRTVFFEEDVKVLKSGNAFYWGFGPGDPAGDYELRFSFGDLPTVSYAFKTEGSKKEGVNAGALPSRGQDWLCKEASSEKRGDSILSCGVGLGKNEADARSSAFNNAKAEFDRVCQISADCAGRTFTVDPRRTSCEQGGNRGIKCYRLVVFNLGGPRQTKKASINRQVTSFGVESAGGYTPTVGPKVKHGMSKHELLVAFGRPESVVHLSNRPSVLEFNFNGRMCLDSSRCYVLIEDNKVIYFDQFKPELTDYLD